MQKKVVKLKELLELKKPWNLLLSKANLKVLGNQLWPSATLNFYDNLLSLLLSIRATLKPSDNLYCKIKNLKTCAGLYWQTPNLSHNLLERERKENCLRLPTHRAWTPGHTKEGGMKKTTSGPFFRSVTSITFLEPAY